MGTRTHGLVAAAVLAGAVVVTGCSDKSTKLAEDPKAAQLEVPSPTGTTFIKDTGNVAPDRPVTFAAGDAAYKAGNYVDATKIFTKLTESQPKAAWPHYMRGLSAWKARDLSTAEAAFEDSLRLNPTHEKSLINLSRVLLDQNRPNDALSRLEEVDTLKPDSNEVQRLFGRAYHALGQDDEAIAAYRKAIGLDGNDTWAMNNVGMVLFDQGYTEEAVNMLTMAVELKKDEPVFQNNLGMALEHTGRFRAAASAYRAALEADPKFEKAQRNLARVDMVKESRDVRTVDVEPEATSQLR
jgi:Flp pilus assembly protein TadD